MNELDGITVLLNDILLDAVKANNLARVKHSLKAGANISLARSEFSYRAIMFIMI